MFHQFHCHTTWRHGQIVWAPGSCRILFDFFLHGQHHFFFLLIVNTHALIRSLLATVFGGQNYSCRSQCIRTGEHTKHLGIELEASLRDGIYRKIHSMNCSPAITFCLSLHEPSSFDTMNCSRCWGNLNSRIWLPCFNWVYERIVISENIHGKFIFSVYFNS